MCDGLILELSYYNSNLWFSFFWKNLGRFKYSLCPIIQCIIGMVRQNKREHKRRVYSHFVPNQTLLLT